MREISIDNLKRAVSKNIELDKFIFAISIRHIGQENAKILAGYFKSVKKFSIFFNENDRKGF